MTRNDLQAIELRADVGDIPTLVAEIRRLQAGGCARDQRTTQYCAEVQVLQREIDRLKQALTSVESKDASL